MMIGVNKMTHFLQRTSQWWLDFIEYRSPEHSTIPEFLTNIRHSNRFNFLALQHGERAPRNKHAKLVNGK